MNYINYSSDRTKKGELMSKEKPLIDYVPHCRKTDQHPQRQDGAGVIAWIAVAFCVGVLFLMAGNAGYFN